MSFEEWWNTLPVCGITLDERNKDVYKYVYEQGCIETLKKIYEITGKEWMELRSKGF